MIEDLKKNIDVELGIIRDMGSFIDEYEDSTIKDLVDSLARKLKTINASIPSLVKEISLAKELRPQNVVGTQSNKNERVEKVINLPAGSHGDSVSLNKTNKEIFLKELRLNENLIRKLKKRKSLFSKKEPEFRKVSGYGKIANRYFLKMSQKMIEKGSFRNLRLDLRRSNIGVLTSTYISIMFLTTVFAFFIGLILVLFLMFIEFSFVFPYIGLYDGSLLGRIFKIGWIIFALPALTWAMLYFYPGAEQKSQGKRIEQELPFVVVHMGSIAGSGIAPSEIFKIIALSNDYKYVGKEIKKILNQTNVYGYDLTTALRNVARATPSNKLAELLNGIGVTINSGGNIKTFFEKRAESLLLEYRIEREKFTKNAETFMDIYISVVISTPMILLLLLIMISVSGISVGLSVPAMSIAIIGIVVAINVIFLGILQMRQPVY